jgi:hypothetical protein
VLDEFVLPFRSDSIGRLGENDLLEFEFVGKLDLGFGMTYGLSTPLLGGRSAGEISRSLGHGIAIAALSAKPAVKMGASFAVRYAHEDAFRFIFSREQRNACLTIYRADQARLTTKVTAGISIDPGARFDFRTDAATRLDAAVDHLEGLDSAVGHALRAKLKTGGIA